MIYLLVFMSPLLINAQILITELSDGINDQGVSIKYIDEVVCYNTEEELWELLSKIRPQVRILGSDYRGKKFTGDDLGIPVHFHKRDHNWSTTRFKDLITDQVLKQRKN